MSHALPELARSGTQRGLDSPAGELGGTFFSRQRLRSGRGRRARAAGAPSSPGTRAPDRLAEQPRLAAPPAAWRPLLGAEPARARAAAEHPGRTISQSRRDGCPGRCSSGGRSRSRCGPGPAAGAASASRPSCRSPASCGSYRLPGARRRARSPSSWPLRQPGPRGVSPRRLPPRSELRRLTGLSRPSTLPAALPPAACTTPLKGATLESHGAWPGKAPGAWAHLPCR